MGLLEGNCWLPRKTLDQGRCVNDVSQLPFSVYLPEQKAVVLGRRIDCSHCRCCGGVFCSKCANKYVTLPGDSTSKVEVYDICDR